MDKLHEQYQEDFSRHAEALASLEEHGGLDAGQREAVDHAARLLRIMASNPTPARSIIDILVQQDRRMDVLRTRAQAQIIWSRIDKTLHQATRATFNLGRVSTTMLAAAGALAEMAAKHRPQLAPGKEEADAMDALEAMSHRLRSATRELSGSTPSAARVDHAGLEKILDHWKPIDSVAELLARFTALGIAWEEPAPAIACHPVHARI